jgi:hypothetical protein
MNFEKIKNWAAISILSVFALGLVGLFLWLIGLTVVYNPLGFAIFVGIIAFVLAIGWAISRTERMRSDWEDEKILEQMAAMQKDENNV